MKLKDSAFVHSLRSNVKGILLMSVAAFLVAGGQFAWKLAAGALGGWLVLGFALYGMGALLMTVSFKFGKLSVVHPFLSLSYVFAIVLAYFFLGEMLRPIQYVGIAAIMVGVTLIGGGDDE